MRKLAWGAIVVALVACGLGHVYLSWLPQPGEPVRIQDVAEEEQEARDIAVDPRPIAAARRHALLDEYAPIDGASMIEPIVVEDAIPEPPPAPEFGGLTLGGQGIRVVPLGPEAAPRPDAEAGQEKMPYARERVPPAWFAAELWDALTKFLIEPATAETAEPPLAEEQSEPERMRPKRPALPPIVDHHYYSDERHCPYTGRCPLPVYPVAPPTAREAK
jgi:hypothetical protein